uniref:(northern house mosquito) hypothetical protein n=1 Tax=Culex pipiens TaxID=7175 RepID=A0A8D8FZ93_CULPI
MATSRFPIFCSGPSECRATFDSSTMKSTKDRPVSNRWNRNPSKEQETVPTANLSPPVLLSAGSSWYSSVSRLFAANTGLGTRPFSLMFRSEVASAQRGENLVSS